MPKITLSPMAQMARGALSIYLTPRLAADAKLPDLPAILKDVTGENWDDRRGRVGRALVRDMTPRLAKDADLDDVEEVLDAIEELKPEIVDASNGGEPDDKEPDDEGEGQDAPADLIAKIREFCAGKMSPEDCAKLDEMLGEETRTMDAEETEEEKKARMAKEAEGRKAADENDKKAMDERIKLAVDAAIKPAIDAAVARERENGREIRDAEAFVRTVGVGELPGLAADGAADVYEAALKARGVETKGVHPSAFRAILENLPREGARAAHVPAIAMDSARKTFDEMFGQKAGRA